MTHAGRAFKLAQLPACDMKNVARTLERANLLRVLNPYVTYFSACSIFECVCVCVCPGLWFNDVLRTL